MRRQPMAVGLAMVAAIGAGACGGLGSGDASPADETSTSAHSIAPEARVPLSVTAVVPYWNTGPGAVSVRDNAATLTTSSPWLLGLDDAGRIVHMTGRTAEFEAAADDARAARMKFAPTIANYSDHSWRHQGIRAILHDAQRRTEHVADIVDRAVGGDWTGVTIDYEGLDEGDRDAFTAFVRELARALHAVDKHLAVDVYAKTDDAGTDTAHRSQDLAALGAAADEIRLMAYTYSWESSPPGPVAPPSWVEASIQYTLTVVPAGKLVLGIPLFGFDWPAGADATPVSAGEVESLIARHRPQVTVDTVHDAPWFTYTAADGVSHEVWFENTCTSADKLSLAQKYRLAGVFLWMYGPEEKALWPVLGAHPPQQCGAAARGAQEKGST